MKQFLVLLIVSLITSCTEAIPPKAEVSKQEEVQKDLEKIEGGLYQLFYGSSNQLKIEGHLDENNQRHGIWTSYTKEGKKLSVVEYNHGLKDGFTVVYHPNGAIRYSGEYRADVKVGKWDFYDTNTGKKIKTEDFGYPEKDSN